MDIGSVEAWAEMTSRDDKTLRMPQSSLGWITAIVSNATQAWTITGGLLITIAYALDTGNLQIVPTTWKPMIGPYVKKVYWIIFGSSTNAATLTTDSLQPLLFGSGSTSSTKKSVSQTSITSITVNSAGTSFAINQSTTTNQVTNRQFAFALLRERSSNPNAAAIVWTVAADLQTAIVRI